MSCGALQVTINRVNNYFPFLSRLKAMIPAEFVGTRGKMKKPDELLGNGNYFFWEFNMEMTLARKVCY